MAVSDWSGVALPWFEELGRLKERVGALFRRADIAGDRNPSVSKARDPGGIIPLWWATSFRNPGRHYPVMPGWLRRNRHLLTI